MICGYAPQGRRSLEEKQSFYDKRKGEWDIHGLCDLVMLLGDLNERVDRHIGGFDGVDGG